MLAVSSALLLIFMSGRFVKYLAQAASGEIDGSILFSIMFFRLPAFLELILPLGLFLGILLTYGRLYVESEMIVLEACGTGKNRLLLYTMGPAFVVMLMVASLSLYLTPLGWEKFHEAWDDPNNFSGLGTIVEGRFQRRASNNTVTYTEKLNDERTVMHGVFVASHPDEKGEEMVVIMSDSGTIYTEPHSQLRYIELEDGYRFQGNPGQLSFTATRFERFGQLIQAQKEKVRIIKSDAKPTRVLFDANNRWDLAALQWRFSIPLTVPIIALIALSLSETNHRRGRYIKLLPAILLYIVYLVMLSGARNAIEEGKLAPEIGFWWIHALFLSIGLLLLYAPGIKRRLKYASHLRSLKRDGVLESSLESKNSPERMDNPERIDGPEHDDNA